MLMSQLAIFEDSPELEVRWGLVDGKLREGESKDGEFVKNGGGDICDGTEGENMYGNRAAKGQKMVRVWERRQNKTEWVIIKCGCDLRFCNQTPTDYIKPSTAKVLLIMHYLISILDFCELAAVSHELVSHVLLSLHNTGKGSTEICHLAK